MIKEFEFYHGVTFSRLFHSSKEAISIKQYPTQDNASYVLNDKVGVYIKYSTKRLTPWRFTFQKRHQDEILELKNKVGEVFLLLVCKDDGIATLSFDEVKRLLNEVHEPVEWISASRHRNEKYAIKGSDGKLELKIGNNEFPGKVLAGLKTKRTMRIFRWSE